MNDFYRKANSGHEYFILKGLNREIREVINSMILPIIKEGKVLDVGCGEQPLRKYFESSYLYKGLDYCQNSQNNIDFLTQIDESALNIYEKFDIILCTEVFEHVFDWKAAFENISNLCSPSGLVLITCPMFYPLHEEPYDFWRPTPYALKKISELNGFTIVEEKRVGEGKDLLGTVLSYSYFYPETNSLGNKVRARLLNRARNYILERLFKQDENIRMESPFFMSNLFLLKRN